MEIVLKPTVDVTMLIIS